MQECEKKLKFHTSYYDQKINNLETENVQLKEKLTQINDMKIEMEGENSGENVYNYKKLLTFNSQEKNLNENKSDYFCNELKKEMDNYLETIKKLREGEEEKSIEKEEDKNNYKKMKEIIQKLTDENEHKNGLIKNLKNDLKLKDEEIKRLKNQLQKINY